MEKLRALGLSRPEEAFLWLVCAGLWEREIEDQEPFPLSAEEWEDVISLARIQTVQGLVIRGIQFLPSAMMPAQQFLWTCAPDLARIEAGYKKVTSAATATDSLLRSLGVKPILQKGLSVARFYMQPQWRVNGDIDWYVGHMDVLKKVATSLQELGYEVEAHADGSISFEQNGVEIELHPNLTDLLSAKGQKTVSELFHSEDVQQMSLPDGSSVDVTGPMMTLLLLESHLMKHVSTVGIGLRQFCDMARAAHVLYGQYETPAFTNTLHRTGMLRWHQLLRMFLVNLLGLPSNEFPEIQGSDSEKLEKDYRWLLRDVLRCGNFGQHTTEWKSQFQRGNGFVTHTLRQILARLPFSLRIAPIETCCQVRTLAYNQIKNKIRKVI